MNKRWWKSSAILGALAAGASIVASPQVLALIPARFAWIGVVIGLVTSQVGQRTAIARNGSGQ